MTNRGIEVLTEMGYMSYDELYKEECPEGRCKRCEYAEVVTAQDQWQFLGCYHEPYHGTWVAEIKDCPKNYSK